MKNLSFKLIVFFLTLQGFAQTAQAFQDTTKKKQSNRIELEASAQSAENEGLIDESSTKSTPSKVSRSTYQTAENQGFIKKTIKSKLSKPKHSFKPNIGKKRHSNENKIVKIKPPRGHKNIIDLDWWMVGIVSALGIAVIILLYFLFGGGLLTFFQMLLFAIGFAATVFFWLLANSENDPGTALYEYFIKFGIFAWPGLLSVIAGFVGLLKGSGTFGGFFLVGLILGGISLLLSIIFKKSILNKE